MTSKLCGFGRQLTAAQRAIVSTRVRQPLCHNEDLSLRLQSLTIVDTMPTGSLVSKDQYAVNTFVKSAKLEESASVLSLNLLKLCGSSDSHHTFVNPQSSHIHLPGIKGTKLDIGSPLSKEEPLNPNWKRLEIIDPDLKGDILEPPQAEDRSMWLTRNMLKIRRKKMNKHKLRKRRRRDEAKRRSISMIRDKKRAKKRAGIKKRLIEKIRKILADNPKSDYPHRPYVVHRLKNW